MSRFVIYTLPNIIRTYLLTYKSSSFSLEHRASTIFSPEAVAEVSVAFNFFLYRDRVASPVLQPPTWRTRSPYLYPLETGWLSYNTPRHRVPILVASYDTHGLRWDLPNIIREIKSRRMSWALQVAWMGETRN
jgi:hypothetical protein